MERFEYQLLIARDQHNVPGGVMWYRPDSMDQPLGSELVAILNELGSEGWEVTGIGDVGHSKRSDILLKRRNGGD